MPRRLTNLQVEHNLAGINLAGIRILTQTRQTGGGAASESTYTPTHKRTRRVIIYVDHATQIVRLHVDATATATSIPLIPSRYIVVDASTANVIHLFDVTGGTNVNFVETD